MDPEISKIIWRRSLLLNKSSINIINPIDIVEVDNKYPNQLGPNLSLKVYNPQIKPVAIKNNPPDQGSIFGKIRFPNDPRKKIDV